MPHGRLIFHCNEVVEKHIISSMNVMLSHPERRMEIQGPKRVKDILKELQLVPEAYLVIRKSELVTEDELIADGDDIEIRPVISGGSLFP